MSERKNVDIAIIGAGSAGMRAYREASKVTDSILLIEGESYGTTCAKVGCMPSKLLIAAAEAAEAGIYASRFGINFGSRSIDGRAVMKRVREERDRLVQFVVDDVEEWPQHHRIRARAVFMSDHLLKLSNGQEIEADRIVIATGSRPNVFPMLSDLGDRLVVNDDVFEWETLPSSVAVFGAGVIGLELSQALHRLGVSVTLFGRDHLVGPLTDPAVLNASLKIIESDMSFYPHAELKSADNVGDAVEIRHSVDGAAKTLRVDYVLAATGRVPNLDGLGLENTSALLNERGVPISDLATGVVQDEKNSGHIFIAGDANNQLPLLHEAADEGAIAGYNAAYYPDIRRFKKSSSISVVFSHPQIMMVGQTHRDLVSSGADFSVGELDWAGQGRSRVMLMNEGLLRVYGDRTSGRFLGAEMIGPRAEHLAHLLAWAHQSNLTISEMLERPFYHPVVEEGVRTALRNLNHELQMGPKPPMRCIDCGPGA